MGAAGSELDPLTELARLIGQSAPVDQRRPGPRDPAPNAPSRDWPAEPPPYAAGYDDHAQHPDTDYGAERYDYPADDDHAVPADQPYGYADDVDPHGGHPEDRFYDDKARPPRRRGGMRTVAALIVLAIVGGGLAFAYRAAFTPGTPPLIARDRGPNKIVTSSQTAEARSTKGDDRIPPGDQADRTVSHERMVSHEERPIALPDSTPSVPGFGQSGAATLPTLPMAASQVATGGPAAPDNAPPRKVQTVTIPAEGAAPVPAPAPPRIPAARAAAAPTPTQPTQLAPRSPATQVATAEPSAPHVAARAEAGGGYYVQVSAQRSEEEAQSSFRGIQEKYANLLGGHEPVIRRKDLGSKGIFFGAQVGPFSRESAVQLCENLKTAGGSCMVQKN